MRSNPILGMVALLVMSSGCTPITNNSQTSQAGATTEATQSSTPEQNSSLPSSGGAAANPPSQSTSSEPRPAGEQGGSTSAPFIAESKAVIQVINKLSPGRLEVVDGCLTVTVTGRERATAVFSRGVKPQFQGNTMVAVSFEGRTLPLNQESPIPGGVIRLSSAELVKPIPSYCPQTLFGLGG